MAIKRLSPCDESQLELLLYGDDRSDAFRVAADHVGSCDVCQHRLTELAADERSWHEVRTLLRDDDTQTLCPTEEAGTTPQCLQPQKILPASRLQLDFLAPPSHPELLGRLGRYEIERVIGVGGMGVVLKGFDTDLNRPVAIKILAPHLAHSLAARERFSREGRAAAAVVHEHVVAIHNVESEGEVPFLVMQYVAGESLQARVDRQGPLSVQEILRIAIQAAAGLAAAHEQGLVHRDIKPANVLLETSVDRALLTDFGLARAIDDASLTQTGIVAGTPHYMSPEQADGRPIDPRSDLFSLGSMLYFMATGHPPFCAERPMAVLHQICRERHRPVRDFNSDIPDRLAATIDRLLDKRPHRRPASAADVQHSLARLLAEIQQGHHGNHSFWHRRSTRRITMSVGIIAAACAAAVAIPTWFVKSDLNTEPVLPPPSPPHPVASAHSGEVLLQLLSIGPSSEAEFTGNVDKLVVELESLETTQAAADAYLRTPSTAWTEEISGARQDLYQLENQPYLSFDNEEISDEDEQ